MITDLFSSGITPLLAFVANPLMLGWLAAASAPLIIHLLNKRKYREAPWAAMQYLMAAIKKNSRRLQLEQWLLLAVRTLLILLVVVAAAEPGFRSAGMLVSSGERVHRVIVVDGSFSMNYKPTGERSYFEQAKQLAERIVDRGREGDGYSLVVLGTPSRTVVATPLFRKEDVRAIISDIVQPDGAGNLTQCLNELDRLLAKGRESHPQIKRREVYFITDLGKQTWDPAGNERSTDAIAEFRTRCERWGAETAAAVIDVGLNDAENAAIVDFTSDEPYAVVGLPSTLRAVVKNFGRSPRQGITAMLHLDGRKVEEKLLNVEAGGETTVVFDFPASNPAREPGSRVYEVEISSDRLEIDNHRRLVLETKPQLRVLLLHEPVVSDEETYGLENLETALRLKPGAESVAASPVRVDVETDDILQRREIGEYDCVFLVDLKRLAPASARILYSYVREGGGLVTWLGPRADAKSYNDLLASGPERILPAKLGPIVAEPQYKLNPLKYAHPLMAEFRGQDQGNLLNTPVYKYYRLDDAGNPLTLRALEFLNNAKDPLIVSEPIGAGRSLMVAVAPVASWTTMPLSPGFVPIVQELLAYACSGRTSRTLRTVGEPLTGSLRRTTASAKVTVLPPAADEDLSSDAARLPETKPAAAPTPTATATADKANAKPTATADGERDRTISTAARRPSSNGIAAEIVSQGEFFRWTFADTSQSGIYTVRISGSTDSVERYAVNVDARESDPAKMAPNRLTDQPWSGIRFSYDTELQDFAEPTQTFVASVDENPIHRWLLMTALAAAIAETWLAGRMGRRRI
ncbi:MAG: BatA domain-containing protein [Planctomycetia bacterium]|nr:BatA domain-containing protein [Planctomycetia bacterium]